MLMLRNLFNITKNKLVLGGQKGQYMGQNSPNKLFITTMADDLKKTEPLQKQTPITPPIKSAKPAIAPRPIPPKPIIPSQPKPIIPPQPIIPKPIGMMLYKITSRIFSCNFRVDKPICTNPRILSFFSARILSSPKICVANDSSEKVRFSKTGTEKS